MTYVDTVFCRIHGGHEGQCADRGVDTFLAPNGAPYCFDDPTDFRADDDMREFCIGCPIAYQADMLIERRCFPPDPLVTPIRQLMDRVDDPLNVRAILAQHHVGFPSDKLYAVPWYQR